MVRGLRRPLAAQRAQVSERGREAVFPADLGLVPEQLVRAGDVGERVANVPGARRDVLDRDRAVHQPADLAAEIVERDATPAGDVDDLPASFRGEVAASRLARTVLSM